MLSTPKLSRNFFAVHRTKLHQQPLGSERGSTEEASAARAAIWPLSAPLSICNSMHTPEHDTRQPDGHAVTDMIAKSVRRRRQMVPRGSESTKSAPLPPPQKQLSG